MDMITRPQASRIELHIEELVLEGFLPKDRYRIGEAVEAELARLLAAGGIGPELASGGAVPSVAAESIRLDGGGPAQMGRQIARSVYGGMKR